MSTGEIIPQAVCSRHGLAVGAYAAWFVRILMWTFAIIAYPISKVLDHLLGQGHTVQPFAWTRLPVVLSMAALALSQEGKSNLHERDQVAAAMLISLHPIHRSPPVFPISFRNWDSPLH